MVNRRKSTEKILDFLESKMPTAATPPKAKASVDEDTMPTPAGDVKIAQGLNPKKRRKRPPEDGKIDEIVEPTNMAANNKTQDLVDRLLMG